MTGVRVQFWNRVRLDLPLGHFARGLRRQQRAHDEPAVLCEVAAVEQLQLARERSDRHEALRVLGSHRECPARRDRERLDVVRMAAEIERRVALELTDPLLGWQRDGRTGRVAREDAGPAVDQVRVLPVSRGQELEVEPRAALERGRHRRVDEHGDREAGAVRRDHETRVEVERVVAKRDLDGVRLRVHLPVHDLGNLVPLLGRGAQADRAARDGPDAVVNDLDPGCLLVEEHAVVLVREHQHVEPALFQVLLVVQGQRCVLGEGTHGAQAERDREDRGNPGGPSRWAAVVLPGHVRLRSEE
jgi:hypothetical protein